MKSDAGDLSGMKLRCFQPPSGGRGCSYGSTPPFCYDSPSTAASSFSGAPLSGRQLSASGEDFELELSAPATQFQFSASGLWVHQASCWRPSACRDEAGGLQVGKPAEYRISTPSPRVAPRVVPQPFVRERGIPRCNSREGPGGPVHAYNRTQLGNDPRLEDSAPPNGKPGCKSQRSCESCTMLSLSTCFEGVGPEDDAEATETHGVAEPKLSRQEGLWQVFPWIPQEGLRQDF